MNFFTGSLVSPRNPQRFALRTPKNGDSVTSSNIKTLCLVTLSSLFLLACGGPSEPSIDHGKSLASLTDSEVQDVCAWEVANIGGDGKKIKCDGTEFTFKTSVCIDSMKALPASCAATYGDVVSCSNAQT